MIPKPNKNMASSRIFTVIGPSILRNSHKTPLKFNQILLPSLRLRHHHRSSYCSSSATVAVDSDASSVSGNDSSPISGHPWPEWVGFVDGLKAKGYIAENGEGECVYTDMKLLKDPCLSFARDRFDVFKSLSTQDIQTVVEKGCPNLLRKVVNSGKRLRAYVQLDEGSVCSSCNLRNSCDRAYVILGDSEDAARTVDIVRVLLHYALDPVVISGEQNPPGGELIEASTRKLFSQLLELSNTPRDPELPQPAAMTSRKKDQSQVPSVSESTNNNEMRPGDWVCTKCNFMNFARNTSCRKCNAEGPIRTSQPGIQKKKGDWDCPQCSYMNFASNRQCHRCREPRPQRKLNPGDWECSECDFLNFSRNNACRKCNRQRPQEFVVQADEQRWRRPY